MVSPFNDLRINCYSSTVGSLDHVAVRRGLIDSSAYGDIDRGKVEIVLLGAALEFKRVVVHGRVHLRGDHQLERLAGRGAGVRSRCIPGCGSLFLSVISEGMGHGSEKMTRVYLASVNSTVVDKANDRLLKLI